jgi:hypothetical protein
MTIMCPQLNIQFDSHPPPPTSTLTPQSLYQLHPIALEKFISQNCILHVEIIVRHQTWIFIPQKNLHKVSSGCKV